MKKRDILLFGLSLLGGTFLFAQTPAEPDGRNPEPNGRAGSYRGIGYLQKNRYFCDPDNNGNEI